MSIIGEELHQMAEGMLNAALTNCEHTAQIATYDMAEAWLRRSQSVVTSSYEKGFTKPDAYRKHMMAANIALKALRILRSRYIETTFWALMRAPVRAPQRGNG